METLGEYLKSKREAQSITLEEIAEATRIREPILVAIENNKHDLIPPRVFIQGFLKSYASYLGLDESDVIKRYQETLEELEAKSDKEEIASQKPPKKVLSAARILVLFIVFVLALALWFFKRPQEKKEIPPFEISQQKPQAELVEPFSVIKTETLEEESEEKVVEEAEGLDSSGESGEMDGVEEQKIVETEQMVLRVLATEETWIKFRLDQGEPFEVLLKVGESFRVKANENFNLRVGNAGGVELFFNEKALGNPGKMGEVIDLTLPE